MLSTTIQSRPADLQGISSRSARVPSTTRAISPVGTSLSSGQGGRDLVELAVADEFDDRGFVELVQVLHQLDSPSATEKSRAGAGRLLLGDAGQHPPDLLRPPRPGRSPAAGRARRPWPGAAGRAGTGRAGRAAGPEFRSVRHCHRHARSCRNSRLPRISRWRCWRACRITLPSPRSTMTSVTDLRQVGAPGDREQMVLALGAGDLDQRLGAEPAGIGQHVAGDLDLVVEGEVLDHLERGVVEPAPGAWRARPAPGSRPARS